MASACKVSGLIRVFSGNRRTQAALVLGLLVLNNSEALGSEVDGRPRVPVLIQASPGYDACPGTARVNRPKGDGFLAVRGGPGPRYSRIDKLRNGDQVYLCVESDDWYGIVYTKSNQDCNVATPWPKSRPYTGPCRSGWVPRQWIELIAG
jgi:hypothetical protein